MVSNPPAHMPRLTPAIFYDDAAAAIEWLKGAFGFSTRLVVPAEDGAIMHAELLSDDALMFVGSTAHGPNRKSPRAIGGAETRGLYIYVDDIDAHFAAARAAGAAITSEPVDMFYGDRIYSATDPEGHIWTFAQHVRDVDPEDMKPPRS